LSGVVEGYQRFDLTSRVWILTIVLRTVGLVAVLALGYKLKAMAAVAIASLAVGYAYNYYNLREVFPALHFSFSRIKLSMFQRMLGYGVHTSVATVAMQLLNQAGPLLVGHFLPTAFVGYFLLPVRLLRYSVDMVCKVGLVTGSNAAEMAARKECDGVYKMGLYVNRYCYALFAPLALALSLYGTELLRVWINPEFALNGGPIVTVIAVSTTWGIAAQFNSSSILYGLGKHQRFAYSLLLEAILSSVAIYVAIPRYGIMGAAWVTAVFMVGNRGLVTSWLFARAVEHSFGAYLRGVYLRPTLAAIPTFLVGWWVKVHWLPGKKWIEVLGGMGLVAATYYLVAFFVCLEKEHRSIPWRWISERFRQRPGVWLSR
jgi:O-antigen/teichoic acid export membrane protein